MPRRKTTRGDSKQDGGAAVTSMQYAAKRKNIPPAGLEAQGRVRETPQIRYEFNPHLPPALRSSPDAANSDQLPEILSQAMKASKPTFSEFSVSDPVRFLHRGNSVQGHIARKTARRALVVAADGSEYQVPWCLLMRNEGGGKKSVNLRIDALKTRFRPDDKVSFPFESGRLRGVIARLGPKRALVACAGGKDYRVPYALLEPVAPDSGRVDQERLVEVSRLAKGLIHRHGLAGWSFQFNDASRQAGRCAYDIQVISLSRLFCLEAPADEVRDTILHEIAHALVGPGHHHDSIWKAAARSIGCSGNRCHDVDFAPPRYIVSCPRCGWSRQANRRRPGFVCKACSKPVTYQTYTRQAWDRMGHPKSGPASGRQR